MLGRFLAFRHPDANKKLEHTETAAERTQADITLNAFTLAAKTAFITHAYNFERAKWLGRPIWQNLADVWTLQESICDDDVDFVIECGTYRGGSAFFMASIFDLLGRGHIVTIDIEPLADYTHPRVTFLKASSIDPETIATLRQLMDKHNAKRPLVVLDSDHSADHVLAELRAYSDLVPVGGYIAVQDGVIDQLDMFADSRPGGGRPVRG
jgi:cephalosporin hydroxylase